MTDEHMDEPTDEEREETISDLEPSEEEAEDIKGGAGSYARKIE
jgi:hypothetical protein